MYLSSEINKSNYVHKSFMFVWIVDFRPCYEVFDYYEQLAIRGDFLLLQFLQSFFAVSRFVFQKCVETRDGLIQ